MWLSVIQSPSLWLTLTMQPEAYHVHCHRGTHTHPHVSYEELIKTAIYQFIGRIGAV